MRRQLELFIIDNTKDRAIREMRKRLDSNEKIHLVSAKSITRNGIRTTSTTWSNGYSDTTSERMP